MKKKKAGSKKNTQKKDNIPKISAELSRETEKKQKRITVAGSFIRENIWMLFFAFSVLVIGTVVFIMTFSNVWGEDFKDYLGTVSDILGISTIIPACAAWLRVKKLENRFKVDYVNTVKSNKEGDTVDLLVSVSNSCQARVAAFINGNQVTELDSSVVYKGTGDYFSIIQYTNVNRPFYHICCEKTMPEKDLQSQNEFLRQYYDCLKTVSKLFQKQGKGMVNLYIAGPAVLGPIIGNVFSNRLDIAMYHYKSSIDKEGEYVFSGKVPKRVSI